MGKIISAGFAVLSKDYQILLGKTDKYKANGSWTIFKGQRESGESLIGAAIRELNEEAGIDIINDDNLNNNTSTSPFYTYGVNDKTVYVFLLVDKNSVLDKIKFNCKSYYGSEPEITEYQWMSLDEATRVIYPSQKGLIVEIKKLKDKQRR